MCKNLLDAFCDEDLLDAFFDGGEILRPFLSYLILVPRDRVFSDTELADHIARVGGNADLFYVGHNYRLRTVARFFSLAMGSVALNVSELRFRSALVRLGMIHLDSGVYQTDRPDKALIAVPQLQAGNRAFAFDGGLREAILRHELSHGEFYTRAEYRQRR